MDRYSWNVLATILNCYISFFFSNFGGKKHSQMIHSLFARYLILGSLIFLKISKAKLRQLLISIYYPLEVSTASPYGLEHRVSKIYNNFKQFSNFAVNNFIIIAEHISFLNMLYISLEHLGEPLLQS